MRMDAGAELGDALAVDEDQSALDVAIRFAARAQALRRRVCT